MTGRQRGHNSAAGVVILEYLVTAALLASLSRLEPLAVDSHFTDASNSRACAYERASPSSVQARRENHCVHRPALPRHKRAECIRGHSRSWIGRRKFALLLQAEEYNAIMGVFEHLDDRKETIVAAKREGWKTL